MSFQGVSMNRPNKEEICIEICFSVFFLSC